jgi:NAD(P) transhydrogenase subunit beta
MLLAAVPSPLVLSAYLVSAVLFILGLKGLTRPRTAVRGNTLGAAAMLLAVVVTLFDNQVTSWNVILFGIAVGSVIGVIMAQRIAMTDMPQLVALFNGLGGGASTLVAASYLAGKDHADSVLAGICKMDVLTATAASGLIGAITLAGSMIAFAKLQGLKSVKDVRFENQQLINAGLAVACVALCVVLVVYPGWANLWFWLMVAAALVLGVSLVIGIGGADMPVVIALLNSYSGIAASMTGFVLGNNLLIIAGSLVGASGLILTQIMCKAMNRSLTNVLFGKIEVSESAGDDENVYANVKSSSPEEIAMMLEIAQKVLIVPGYGMAVAQAQHAVRDLANGLAERDIEVEYGIHPVAGRMPGHMNVLLAEANIPYEQLKEMDEVNSSMDRVDVAIVLGANDVVNPVAREPGSPIAGMPIIDVDKARTAVVVKRSLSPGFAGIANPLFAADNSLMLFGDAREMVTEILKALQEG